MVEQSGSPKAKRIPNNRIRRIIKKSANRETFNKTRGKLRRILHIRLNSKGKEKRNLRNKKKHFKIKEKIKSNK